MNRKRDSADNPAHYTRGPWRAVPQRAFADSTPDDGRWVIEIRPGDGYKSYIAEVVTFLAQAHASTPEDTDGRHVAESAANARLIASAPELLATLQAVEEDCMDRGDCLLWTSLGAQIQKAISAAIGER